MLYAGNRPACACVTVTTPTLFLISRNPPTHAITLHHSFIRFCKKYNLVHSLLHARSCDDTHECALWKIVLFSSLEPISVYCSVDQ